MKAYKIFVLILPLLLVASSCRYDEEVTLQPFQFEADVLGIGGDCQLCLIEFMGNEAEVEAIIGLPPVDHKYYALGLDEKLIIGGLHITLNIRKPDAGEIPVCSTMGLAYPAVFVTKAAAK